MDLLHPDVVTVAPAELVGQLSTADRARRVTALTVQAHAIVDDAIYCHLDGRTLAGTCILWSGGSDSNVLAHLMRDRATHAAHANTGIGIEQTRQHVRDTCARWSLPLIEKHPPPGSTYRELVLDQGFPGKAHHWKMYQRLKERCLRQVRRELVTNARRERVLFLAGRRRAESARRSGMAGTPAIPLHEREGSVIWASPIAMWTKLDLNTYRALHLDVPHNPVTDLLHMSGECLCGAFAKPYELDQVRDWFPEVAAHIEALEQEVLSTGRIPAERCRWGWGDLKQVERLNRRARLCSSCDPLAVAVADSVTL